MTVLEYAKKCMNDEEFKAGGVPKNERRYLDEIGFEYKVRNGAVCDVCDDLQTFYRAVYDLVRLNEKYQK